MVTTALNPPQLSFADEQVPEFEVTAYYSPVTFNGVTSVQLKAGYWDQNVRNPGSFLPRDGGSHYNDAWAQVDRHVVTRAYVESWNEYDEGSGIYAANTGGPFIKPGSGNTHTDTWSSTNDPYQYIKATAAGAGKFNDMQPLASTILYQNFPKQMQPGEVFNATVVVRNDGNTMWSAAQQFKFGQQEYRAGEVVFGSGRYLIDDAANEVPIYGGVFRGRPVTFSVRLVAPARPGNYLTHWSTLQEHVAWFGQELDWTIAVVPEPSGATLAALGLVIVGLALRQRRANQRP
jgi:hypothetical protein